jgi:SulP family sulfate permease
MGARSFGAQGPLAGILSGVVCGVGLVFSGQVLPYVPWFVPAGLLVFMGFGLMYRWLVQTRSEFTQAGDYSLLLLIFLLIASLGFLTGLAVGVALAMMVLVVRYGGVDVVRHVLFGDHHRSNVDRAPYQLKVLHEKGGRIMILRLQGFLFLGTTNSLVRRIRKRAEDRNREPLKYIILDFTRISGLDSSVCLSFAKLRQVVGQYDATLLFTNVPFEMEQQLELGGCVLNAPEQGSLTFVSVDYAMEWCENRILESEDAFSAEERTLNELLKPMFPEAKYIPILMKVLKKIEVKEGELVFRQGDASDAMYFIEKGMISIRLELEGGRLLRLKKMRPGTVFGEMGIYTNAPRTASAVAAEDCRLYRLSKSTLEKLKTVNPQFTSAVHRFIVNLLSARVAEANTMLRDLLK